MRFEISPFKNWIACTTLGYRVSLTKGRHVPKGKQFEFLNYGYCDIRKIRIHTAFCGVIICWKVKRSIK